MTTDRRYGEGTPFGVWLRKQSDIDSHQHAFIANDQDWLFQRYRLDARDKVGTRDLQALMDVEVKTRNGRPNSSQQETLWFRHQRLDSKDRLLRIGPRSRVSVWNFGVFVLVLGVEEPKNQSGMLWGKFNQQGELDYQPILWVADLKDILSFRTFPDNPCERFSWRRHHKTKELIVTRNSPLGFEFEEIVKKRS
jgi:hypothetical protein